MKTLLTAIVAFAGTTLYLALAAWGWGGVGPFLAHPARVALVAIFYALTLAALFSGGNISTGEREDRSNRWVVLAFTVLGLLGAWASAYTDRRNIWVIDGDAMRWTGVALTVAGGLIRLWPVFVLGNRFSGLVAIQPGHRLVTTGIYAHVRNPSYVGLLLSAFAWAIAFRSLVGILITLPMIPVTIARIRSEERLLAGQFGEEYDSYRRRTWRLIPGIY